MKRTIALIIIGLLILSFPSKAQTQTQKPTMITVTATLDQWNVIINALNELPAKTANPIISTITSQAQQQLQPPPVKKDTIPTVKQPAKKN